MSGGGVLKYVTLGASGIEVPEMGVGVWQWGDAAFWGYGKEYGAADIRAAFEVCNSRGLNFFDTAEIYGSGASERNLGTFIREAGRPAIVASKFFPYPWRLRGRSVTDAARASLQRLGLERIDLYQIHWPYPPMSIETWMGGLADAVDQRLIRRRGRVQLQRAADAPGAGGAGAAQRAAGFQSGAVQPVGPAARTFGAARNLPATERLAHRLLPAGAGAADREVHAPAPDARVTVVPPGGAVV